MREITNQRARGSANLVKYAPIYQWRAYQLPLLPTGMTIKPANCSDAGQRRGIVQGEKERSESRVLPPCSANLSGPASLLFDRPLLAINLI